MRRSRCWQPILWTAAWCACGAAPDGLAQSESAALAEPWRFYLDYPTLLRKEWALVDAPAISRTPKLQMFRMPSGFLGTPLGLVSDDDPILDESPARADDGSVQLAYGQHVPYLDMHRRGDPGGLGYYRIHSQMQVFDLGPTNVSLNLQALTPMGLQC